MDINQAAEILEVSTNISKDELKKKFKRLVMKYHPDRNKDHDSTKNLLKSKKLMKHYTPIIQILNGCHNILLL